MLGLLVLGAAAVATGVAVRYVQTPPAVPEPSEPAVPGPPPTTFPGLPAQIARSDDRVFVTNDDTVAWTRCSVDLDAGVFPGGYSQELGSIAAGARASVPIAGFRRRDGTVFDPATPIQVVDVHCDTPTGRAHFNGVF